MEELMKKTCKVYLLVDPETKEKMYVGQTRCRPGKRLKFHLKSMRRAYAGHFRPSPVQCWLHRLALKGLKPIMEILDDNATWDIAEAVWIDRLTKCGHKLLNCASRVS